MILSKEQYNKLPEKYKVYFNEMGGDANKGELKRNTHPT